MAVFMSITTFPQTEITGYIPVEGGNIWYKITGSDKPGVPVLCLHGGPGAPHNYLKPLEELADERPVIFYDQLGCGNSDTPDDTTLWRVERFMDEVDEVRKTLNLETIYLFGQSWGTALMTSYMLDGRGSGVVGLIFDAPFLSVSKWIADQEEYLKNLPVEMQKAVLDADLTGNYSSIEYQTAMMEFYKRHVCRLDPWPDYVNETFAKMGVAVYNYMWGPSEFKATGSLKNLELVDSLNQIKIPSIFICGEFDEATPETTASYSSIIPNSEFHVIPGSSHMHHAEKQEEFITIVRDFLRRTAHR